MSQGEEEFAAGMNKTLGQNHGCFLGATGDREKGPVMLGFFGTDVPLKYSLFKGNPNVVVTFHALWAEQEGFTQVNSVCTHTHALFT